MKDVQNLRDNRNVDLDYVGITGVDIPIKLKDKKNKSQKVQAIVDAMVNLKKSQKGIHMSHIVDKLFKLSKEYGMNQLVNVAKTIKDDQTKENRGIKTKSCRLSLRFRYFIEKTAPVSKEKSLLGYWCAINVIVGDQNEKSITVKVPVSTCCPCSLELCDNKAAHNQRGIITITSIQSLSDKRIIWFEDLIKIAEASGSCEIYPVLRRPDEKYVTDKMFQNPKFVEDVVRDTVVNLRKKYPKLKFIVSCSNMESIHDHAAYAETYVNGNGKNKKSKRR